MSKNILAYSKPPPGRIILPSMTHKLELDTGGEEGHKTVPFPKVRVIKKKKNESKLRIKDKNRKLRSTYGSTR